VSRIQIWSESGRQLFPGAEECQEPVGTEEWPLGLWLHGGEGDRKRWLLGGMIKGKIKKKMIKEKILIINK